jgi:hypothetical protein
LAQPPLPPEHHVARHAKWTQLRKDGDDNVTGLLPEALRPDEGDSEISVTWCEYFAGTSDEQFRRAVTAFNRDYRPSPKSRFAVGNVGAAHAAAAECDVRIRIVHEPEGNNPAHSTIRRLPRDNEKLLSLLAERVFTDLHVAKDIMPLDPVAAPGVNPPSS